MSKDLNLKELPYRQGVGIILVNADQKVFVGQRLDTAYPAWQMPQGGIDKGETPVQAALRELEEEIGTNAVEMKAESPSWYTYNFPQEFNPHFWQGQYKGQRQKWFLFQFTGQDSDISLETEHPEFQDWKWVPKEDLVSLAVPFKRDLYKAVIEDLWGK